MRPQSNRGPPQSLAGCRSVQPLGKLSGSSVKVKMNMLGDLAVSLLGINPKENVFLCTKEGLLKVFVTTLFTVVRHWSDSVAH